MKDWLKPYRTIGILSKRLKQLEEQDAQKEEIISEILNKLKEQEVKRITLDDLKLKPNQIAILKSSGRDFRQALYDLGEHKCLTESKECCRKSIINYRAMLMAQTHDKPKNTIPSDRTDIDEVNERRTKFFQREVSNT